MSQRRLMRAFTLIEMLVVIAIISTLAGMLLPSLSSAREKGRRISCMNNLNQISKGLEGYSGSYGGYFPCHAAYGAEPCTRMDSSALVGWNDSGRYIALRPSDHLFEGIRTNSTMAYNGGFRGMTSAPTRYRTVFIGDWAQTPDYDDVVAHRSFPALGHLSLAPQGLGYLVVENYMPDAQVLYCPTVAGSMPIPVCQRSNIPPLYAGQDGGAGVGRMKKAGGFDGKAILFGDWSDLGYFSKAYDKARAVFSDYAYRNTPIALVAGFEANTPPYPAPWTPARLKPFQLGGTKPAVMTQVAVPAFKTHKTLGQRSIAADSFGRGHDGNYGSIQAPGDGNFAHKDGYNVLYGDGHAAWYADSIQRLIYWPEPDLGSMPYSSQNVISDLCVMASSQGSGLGWWRMEGGGRWDALSTERTGPWDSNQNCGAAVWHLLDVAAGIDVDAQ